MTEKETGVDQTTWQDIRQIWSPKLAEKVFLYVALTTVMAAAGAWVWFGQKEPYDALTRKLDGEAVLSAACVYHLRANLHLLQTGFMIRLVGLIFGAVLASVGGMFVLRGARAAYELEVQTQGQAKGTLRTTSPGLVMISLGVAMAMTSVLRTQEFRLDNTACFTAPMSTPAEAPNDSVPIVPDPRKPARPDPFAQKEEK